MNKNCQKKKIILAMQNHDEVYIAYYQIPQLFYSKCFLLFLPQRGDLMLKMAFRRVTVYFEDQIFKNLETKMVFHFLRSKVESNPNKCTNLHVLNMK